MKNQKLIWYRDDLKLHCGHFVVSPSLIENLHGHTYTIKVECKGTVDSEADVLVDFLQLKPIVKKWIEKYNFKLLLPELNPMMSVQPLDKAHLEVRLKKLNKTYVFPNSTVEVIPITNTTVERLSSYFSKNLSKIILEKYPNIVDCTVTVGEYFWSASSATTRNEEHCV